MVRISSLPSPLIWFVVPVVALINTDYPQTSGQLATIIVNPPRVGFSSDCLRSLLYAQCKRSMIYWGETFPISMVTCSVAKPTPFFRSFLFFWWFPAVSSLSYKCVEQPLLQSNGLKKETKLPVYAESVSEVWRQVEIKTSHLKKIIKSIKSTPIHHGKISKQTNHYMCTVHASNQDKEKHEKRKKACKGK